MPLFSFAEIFDIIVMTIIVGYIFSGAFRKPIEHDYDPLAYFKKQGSWENFKYAVILTAPAIILHELAHKFVAMSFGLRAVYYAFYHNSTTLGLGVFAVLAKMMNFGFFILVPGFVATSGAIPLQQVFISLAGPLTNLVIWALCRLMLQHGLLSKYQSTVAMTAKINLFLFIFNMLPIPGFDGFNFFVSLFEAFS